jgi:hypothetical protein
MTVDGFVLLTPVLLLGVIALLRFVGCAALIQLDDIRYNPAATTPLVTLSASPEPSDVGMQVTLKAIVTPDSSYTGNQEPTGNVTFQEGSNNLGVQVLDNSGTATLATIIALPGPHLLTAVYQGDHYFNPNRGDVLHKVNSPATPPPAGITLGQPPQAKQQAGTPPIAVTLSGTKKGGLILVTVSWGSAGTVSISDGSNIYQSAGNGNWSGQQAQTFYAVNNVGGNLTITASGPGTSGPCSLCVSEYLNTAAALPVYSFASKASPSVGGALNVTVTPANVGDMIYAVAFAQNGNLTVGSGFTSETTRSLGTISLTVADELVAAPGTATVGITNGVSTSPWVILALAIKHG